MMKKRKKSTTVDPYWTQLLQRNGYPQTVIDQTAGKLEKLPADLQDAVRKWDDTGDLPPLSAEGISLDDLTTYFGLHEIAAFLMLDWLRREPAEARYALTEPKTDIVIDEETIEKIRAAEECDQPAPEEMPGGSPNNPI